MRSSTLPLLSFAAPIAGLFDGIPPEGTNPLALGFYTTPEQMEPMQLEIEGEIPKWLTGSLYRGAHAGWDAGNYTSEHWFDGFSRNHRFEIEDGRVIYRNRNASDELVDFVRETGLYPGASFGGDPCKAILGAYESTFRNGPGVKGEPGSDAIKVSYVKNFPGLARNSTNLGPFVTLVTTTDGPTGLQQIDPMTLEPIELFTYNASESDIWGQSSGLTAAHPAVDEGELYNYVLDVVAQPPAYQVFGIYSNGSGRVLANVTDAPPAYIHSLFSTENHVVLIIWQADFGPPPSEKSGIVDWMTEWDPERPVFFYVIDKKEGGIVAKYIYEKPFFAFHEINSFEKDGDIIIDIPIFNDTTWVREAAKMESLRANFAKKNDSKPYDLQANFARFRLPNVTAGKREECKNGTLEDKVAIKEFELQHEVGGIELPKINEAYLHKEYRYSYGVHTVDKNYFMDSIIKIDAETQESTIWFPETRHTTAEPIFVANPEKGEDADEDDGVLVFVGLDGDAGKSSFIVLDAKTMTEVGRARMPLVVGFGFHGIWGEGAGMQGNQTYPIGNLTRF